MAEGCVGRERYRGDRMMQGLLVLSPAWCLWSLGECSAALWTDPRPQGGESWGAGGMGVCEGRRSWVAA